MKNIFLYSIIIVNLFLFYQLSHIIIYLQDENLIPRITEIFNIKDYFSIIQNFFAILVSSFIFLLISILLFKYSTNKNKTLYAVSKINLIIFGLNFIFILSINIYYYFNMN